MKRPFILIILALAVAAPWCLAAPQSLGEFARQQREQREKSGVKPVKVFTNDNLPARPPREGPTAASGMATTPPESTTTAEAKPATGEAAQGEQGEAESEKPEDKKQTKEYWQAKFKAARAQLADAQEQQQVSEDELNLLQIQQARELDQVAKDELDRKVQAKQAEVTEKRQSTEKVRADLDKLQNEFNDSGAPEDWSKTE